jgi:hypothetical protein
VTVTPLAPIGLAYRDWLLRLAHLEASEGCPRLFAMKSDVAMYFADTVAKWGSIDRYALMCACIKNLFEGNYGYPTTRWSDAERAAFSEWDFPYFGHWRTPGKAHVEITWASSGSRSVVDANKVKAAHRRDRAEHGPKVNGELLRAAIRDVMTDCYGVPHIVGPLWSFTRLANGLTIKTHLDFGVRRPGQFRYWQSVSEAHGDRGRILLPSAGICSLLGWPRSEWCFLTDADVPMAAALLFRLCNEFVDALPWIVEHSREEEGKL